MVLLQAETPSCDVQSDGEVTDSIPVSSQSANGEVDVMTSVDNRRETDSVVDDGVASTHHQSATEVDDCTGDLQPDISLFPFVTVSPCRRKATTPTLQRQPDGAQPDDLLLHGHADHRLQLSSSASTSTVTAGSSGGWMSPAPTVSSTWMSPARVTTCTVGSETPSPSPGGSCLGSQDCAGTAQISPLGGGGDVPQSPDTVSAGAGSPATSTPAGGSRVGVIKVPVYSPVYRHPAATAASRRHSARPPAAVPRRCAVVASHHDVLDLSASRYHPQQQQQQHHGQRPSSNPRRAITFSDGSQRDRRQIVDTARVPLPSPDKSRLVGPGSLSRKLSVSTDSRAHHRSGGECESVVVCERHEADSASVSPCKTPLQPTAIAATTTTSIPASAVAAAASASGQTSTTLSTNHSSKDCEVSACSSRLVVNLQRCDLSAALPTAVAMPGRARAGGGSKRRHHAVGGPPPLTNEHLLAAASAPSKRRRRLKLMCNGMTIYRDIDDVAASNSSSRGCLRTSSKSAAAAARRRASLPTFPDVSLSNSVTKRRHMSTDDVTSLQSRDREPPLPVAPSVELPSPQIVSTESFHDDRNDSVLTGAAVSEGDSGIGPLDYSTDRSSSIGTVPTDNSVPSSVPDSSLMSFDEPLELTTQQVRERQKNDCRQLAVVNQFAIC